MKNDISTLSVNALGSDGEGIARRDDGYTYFVTGALPGDTIKMLVLKENKSYGYGKVLEILNPSPHRIEPKCPVFGKCGGCTLLNADYEFQKELKRRTVVDAFERIGGFRGIDVGKCVGGDCFEYRNKAQYPLVQTDDGVKCGFYAPHSHRVVPNEFCALQDKRIREITAETVKWINKKGISVYNEETGKGCLRHIYVRVGANEALLVLVANYKPRHCDALVERLRTRFSELVGVVVNINNKKTNTILGEKQDIVWGRDYITDSINKIKYKIHYKSFYQVNPSTTRLLYDHVFDCCGLTGNETVYDLYCGCGTIGLYLAEKAKKIIGVELVPEAVENANENAELNDITNAEFYCGKAEELCPKMVENGEKADVVVLDPPRKGCEEGLLRAAAQMQPKKIVYVSCNPSTAARDCKLLASLGYEIDSTTPFDQFPHTCHVECVVLMSRAEK